MQIEAWFRQTNLWAFLAAIRVPLPRVDPQVQTRWDPGSPSQLCAPHAKYECEDERWRADLHARTFFQ